MSEHKELTRYAFISHMEDYIKQLLTDPVQASPDEFLNSHGITGPVALKMLLTPIDKNDADSVILRRKVSIKTNFDEDGKRKADTFTVKYKLPRKDYNKKMRNLYISNFESNICEGLVMEDGEGGGSGIAGATNCASSGQYTAPAFPVVRRKTAYMTEEQLDYIKSVLEEEAVECTRFGSFGYDAPPFKKSKKDFFKSANNHKNIFKSRKK